MKMINKLTTCFFTGILLLWMNISESKAQTPAQVIENIYKTYDSIPYLSFDVTYHYNSDTINKVFVSDMLKGTYTLAGKKAWFVLDNIEFMQNDSFFISVNKEEKFILISNPRNENAGRELPLRLMIDSMLNNYSTMFTVSQSTSGDTGTIRFENSNLTVDTYGYFEISYDINNYILYGITHVFKEEAPMDDYTADLATPEAWKRKLTVVFDNYRFDNVSSEVYNEGRFIFTEDGEYKPVEKYQDYRIFNSKIPGQ